jgi:hypothetical protein
MIFLIACLIPAAIFGALWYKGKKEGEYFPDSMFPTMLCFMLALLVLICLILSPYTVRQEIAEYYAVKQSIENARAADIGDIERAALTQKIIDTNKWLAKTKYANSKLLLDDFIPDEVENLEPLR